MVCYSADDAIKLIDEYMKLKKEAKTDANGRMGKSP